MKKVLAVVLALIMAFSCASIAFADTTYTCPYCSKTFTDETKYMVHCFACMATTTTKATTATTGASTPDVEVGEGDGYEVNEQGKVADNNYQYGKFYNECVCGAGFTSEELYLEHIKTCPVYQKDTGYLYGMNIQSVLDKILEYFSAETDFVSVIESIVLRIMDLIENIGTAAVAESDVAGAVDELEEKVATLPLASDATEYVGNLITTLKQKVKDLYAHDVETVAEEPVSTGSSSAVGIAAFAAVSVAAAAVYVCTRKKEED